MRHHAWFAPAIWYDWGVRLHIVFAVAALSAAAAGLADAQVVTKVDSGDTIVVEGVGEVRLLGIRHTDESAFRMGGPSAPPARTGPETPPPTILGGGINLTPEKPARDLLRQLVLGKAVRLQYDPLAGDKGGRRAYVFVADDTLVNAEMIRRGRARVDDDRPFAHEQEFRSLERDAQASRVGVWAGVTPK